MSTTTTIEHVIEIDASPATVYELWTTGEGLQAWWAIDAQVEVRAGGSIRIDIDGEHVMVGEFLELDPPHTVRFTFGWENGTPGPGGSIVEVHIEPTASGSRLTLRHHGLPVDAVESHGHGWRHFAGERLVAAARTP